MVINLVSISGEPVQVSGEIITVSVSGQPVTISGDHVFVESGVFIASGCYVVADIAESGMGVQVQSGLSVIVQSGVYVASGISVVGNVLVSSGEVNADISDLITVLRSILFAIANPSYVDKSANQMRAVITGSLTTAGTVSTVTGLTNIDLYQGKLLMIGTNNLAWAQIVRTRIT